MAKEFPDMKIGFLNSIGHPMEVGLQESSLWVQQTSQYKDKLNLNKLFLNHLLVPLLKEDTKFMLVILILQSIISSCFKLLNSIILQFLKLKLL